MGRFIDRAYWNPGLILAAQRNGCDAIFGYAYDPYVSDVNGYCGGWTPAAADEVRSSGLHFGCIFTFRDGDVQPTPERCVQLAQALGLQPGDWVCSSDTESGAMPARPFVQANTDALEGAQFQVLVYGNAGTLNTGYLTDARAPWVASYIGSVDPAPALAEMPNVGSWQQAAWQYTDKGLMGGVDFDVSVHNLTWGTPASAPPAPGEEIMAFVAQGDGTDSNHGANAVFIVDGIHKRYLSENWETSWWTAKLNGPVGGNIVSIPQDVLDRMEEEAGIWINQTEPATDLAKLALDVAAIKAKAGA